MNEENLAKIKESQKWILKLYKRLQKVLEENGIEYFATGGTAIGALRENGFIEWDDDLDFAVPEHHVEKLKKVLKENGFITIDKHENTNVYLYEKVYDENILTKDPDKEEGWLWIDIFIAYEHRRCSRPRAAWKNTLEFILHIKKGRIKEVYKIWKWYEWFPYTLLRLLPITKSKLRKMAVNSMKNKKYLDPNGKWYFYHNTKTSNFVYLTQNGTEKVKFEDTYIPVTKNFAVDSKPFFGDIYKKPAPKDRVNHGFEIIENKYTSYKK